MAGEEKTKTNTISKTWCDRIDLLICIDSVISTYVEPHRLVFYAYMQNYRMKLLRVVFRIDFGFIVADFVV